MNGTPACAGPAKQWLSTGACETGPTSPEGSARPAGRPTSFQRKAQTPLPSEPILIPKLRIQFADFPYLHYSIDQRLLTLETCCGYGYELVRVRRNPTEIFKVPPTTRGCNKKCYTLRQKTKTHSLFKRIPGTRRLMQKRQLFPEFRWASLSLFVLPRLTRSKTVPLPGSGI